MVCLFLITLIAGLVTTFYVIGSIYYFFRCAFDVEDWLVVLCFFICGATTLVMSYLIFKFV